MKKEKNKQTIRTEEEKKLITNRINRIKGQISGIEKMINNDFECNDILIQTVAVEKSVKSLSNFILESHLQECVTKELKDKNTETINELIGLFKKFNQ